MDKLKLIIKREFIAKVRNKSFIVMTFLSPLLFVGIAAFVGFLSTMKADLKTIAIHDETGKFVKEFKSDEEIVDILMSNLTISIDSSKVLSAGTHFKFTEPSNLVVNQKYLVYTTKGKIDSFETVHLEKTVLTKTLNDLVAGEQYIIQLVIETPSSTNSLYISPNEAFLPPTSATSLIPISLNFFINGFIFNYFNN